MTGAAEGCPAARRQPAAAAPRVLVPRPEELEKKRARLAGAGAKHLQVVVDFDHTLTRFVAPDGGEAHMCHDIIEKSPLMPEALREDYAGIWADTFGGKLSCEAEWWHRAHELFKRHGLTRQGLPQMIQESQTTCREHCGELFSLLERHDVPVLIASAGLTQVIEVVMEQAGIPLGRNVRIIANDMHFDPETGALLDVLEPLVIPSTKKDIGTHLQDHFAEIDRRHVVLVGDSTSDTTCLENVAGLEETVNIGFFNASSKGRQGKLPRFEQAFDMVLSTEGIPAGTDLTLLPIIDYLKSCGLEE